MEHEAYMNQLLTVQDAAREVNCHEETIRRAYRSQFLKAMPFGRRNKRIRRRDLRTWQEAGMRTVN
jgi:excisionase family DNA binding protein